MKKNTKFFGEIDVEEKDIITFNDGIPGFVDLHKFTIIHDESYLSFMQSLEEERICFILIPPALVENNYDIEISETTVKALEVEKPEDVLIYAIVTVPEKMEDMTANLRAPILVNIKNNLGIQEVLDDSRFGTKHRIAKEA